MPYVRPNVSLYLRNLPETARSDELRSIFSKYGSIRDVYVPCDHFTGRPRGFAYVEYEDIRDAEDAVYHLGRGVRLHGRDIDVEFAVGDRKTPGEMRQKYGPMHRSHDRDRRSASPRRHRRSRSRSRRRSRSRHHGHGRRSRSRTSSRHRSSGHRHRNDRRRSGSESVSRSRSPKVRRSRTRSRSKSYDDHHRGGGRSHSRSRSRSAGSNKKLSAAQDRDHYATNHGNHHENNNEENDVVDRYVAEDN